MKDALGDRIKYFYEDRTRFLLPRRTYTIARLDGKAFHTYTKGLKKPFDQDLSDDIDSAIIDLLPQIQGAKFAYTQSDEISILITDFGEPSTSAWFDGNLQKMTSVAASILTAGFNKYRMLRQFNKYVKDCDDIDFNNLGYFDSRIFTIPDRIEVMNYFRWRQSDCCRNSVSMVAQSKFSHKELQRKSQSQMHDMLHEIGVNWTTDYTDGHKNGRVIIKETYKAPNTFKPGSPDVERSRWVSTGAWVFTKDEGKLLDMIPKYE
jgi:tRNA(His) guanylyltransferase